MKVVLKGHTCIAGGSTVWVPEGGAEGGIHTYGGAKCTPEDTTMVLSTYACAI